jgi:hypothetical protein
MGRTMTAHELACRSTRFQDVRRWAYFNIGAMMCSQDTGALHGPRFEYVNPQGCIFSAQDGADVRTLRMAADMPRPAVILHHVAEGTEHIARQVYGDALVDDVMRADGWGIGS